MTMSQQEIFTKVATHLLTQNARSRVDFVGKGFHGCAYRGEGGLSCAVGCLIQDQHYRTAFESLPASDLSVQRALQASGVLEATTEETGRVSYAIALLGDLQSIHDAKEVRTWPDALAELAAARGLTMPEMP